MPPSPLRTVPLAELTIRGERALRPVAVYAELKRALLADGFAVRVPSPDSPHAFHDRALFLNLTFWNAGTASDVLVDDTVEADVVAHAAWHHLARKATGGAPTHAALFLGESIASAFDLYLVGHLLRQPQRAGYLTTQVPAMAAAAANAGVSDEAFASLLEDVAADPDAAFEDLRALLFDASMALTAAPDADAAVDALDALADHRFAGLLHHYELAVWTLYARAYARPSPDPDPALAIDAALRAAPSAMEWLRERWLSGGGVTPRRAGASGSGGPRRGPRS